MAGGLRGGIIFRRGFLTNFWAGWGRIEVTICDRAGKLDRTAQSMTSTIQQSMSVCEVGGWNSRGMVWRLRFLKGIFVRKKIISSKLNDLF